MKNTLRLVILRFLSLLLIYFFIRIFYQVYNYSSYQNTAFQELFNAYLNGWRFDISAILKLNAIFFIIWLIPYQFIHSGIFNKILSHFFIILNILFILAGTADAELVHFSGQRLTLNYFAIIQDIQHQFGQLIQYYWKPVLFTCALVFLFIKIQPKPPLEFHPIKPWPLKIAVLILTIFTLGLGIRGGFQNKPLRPAHAFLYSSSELGQLSLNSTFTILQSGRKSTQTKFNFMPETDLKKYLSRDRSPHFKNFWQKKQNIIIIIMESLALEYVGAGSNEQSYTPFFDKLAERGLLFTNAFANGRRSIEAVPSILASLPSLLNDPFLTSNYQGTKILGLGEILTEHGYATQFFHGAVNGSMFFDSFSARAGFKKYYGLNEYPEIKRDYDGFWGILDEPFFKETLSEINKLPKPFASVIFSLSSHQPYSVPAIYKGKFPKGTLEIHESLGYADYALEKFFERAEQEIWFQDTLFIITGDHTQKSNNKAYQNDLGHYRVPILFYHPALKNKSDWPSHDLTKVIQHADILPSTLDTLDLPQDKLSLVGSSVFSKASDAFAINKTSNAYWYLSNKHLIRLDLNQEIKTFKFDQTKLEQGFDPIEPIEEPLPDEIMKMKAFLQYYTNGIIENRLFH